MLVLLLAATLQAWITDVVVNTYGYAYAIQGNTLITLYPNGTQAVYHFPQSLTVLCLSDDKVVLGTRGGVWINHKFIRLGEGWVTACKGSIYARSLCCPPRSFVGNLTINDTVVGITDKYILTWRGMVLNINGVPLKKIKGYITSYDVCRNKLVIATCCPDRVYVLEIPSLKTSLKLDVLATKVKFIYCKYLAIASRVSGVEVYSLDGKPVWHLNVDTFTFDSWADKLFAGLNRLESYTINVPMVRCMAIKTYVNTIIKLLDKSARKAQLLLFVDELKRWLLSFVNKFELFKKLVYSKPSFTYILDVNYASLILNDMIKELDSYMSTLHGMCESCYKIILPYYKDLKDSAFQCVSYLNGYAKERWQKASKALKIEKPLIKYLISSNVTCVGSEVVVGLIIQNEPNNPPLICNIRGETFSIQPGLAVTKTLIVKITKEGTNIIRVPITCTFLDKKVEEVAVIKIIGKKCR